MFPHGSLGNAEKQKAPILLKTLKWRGFSFA